MPRPQTKEDLLAAASENFDKLMNMIDQMTDEELNTEFNFSHDEKKKEAHWKRDKNLRDILIHLYEWHKLTLDWIDANNKGENKPLLPKEYTWRTYGDMNVMFWKRNQNTSLSDAKVMLNESHTKIMKLIEQYTNEELFSRDAFPWTGGNALGSYFVSNTSSHYD